MSSLKKYTVTVREGVYPTITPWWHEDTCWLEACRYNKDRMCQIEERLGCINSLKSDVNFEIVSIEPVKEGKERNETI